MKPFLSWFQKATHKPAKRKNSCCWNLEELGTRINPAVSVTFSGGLMTIIGDGLDNNITISRSGTSVTVASNNSQVVGQATAKNVSQVAIKAGGGNDIVTFNSVGSNQLASLAYDGGDGNDNITLTGVQVSGAADFTLGNGTDSLYFAGFAKSISVDGGLGDNTTSLYLGAGDISSVTVDSPQRAQSGIDNVLIRGSGANTRVGSIDVRTGKGNDVINIGSIASSGIYIHGGNDFDRVYVGGISFFGSRKLDADGIETLN